MKYDVVIVGGERPDAGQPIGCRRKDFRVVLEAGARLPDPEVLPDDVKFGHTRFAEAPDSRHDWALRGTITEEQGAIHGAPRGRVMEAGRRSTVRR